MIKHVHTAVSQKGISDMEKPCIWFCKAVLFLSTGHMAQIHFQLYSDWFDAGKPKGGKLRKRKKGVKERRDPGFQLRTEVLELSLLPFF